MCAWSVCGSVCQDQDQPPVQRSAVDRLWTELRSRQSWSVSCSHAWPCRIVLALGMPAARFKWIRGARSEATEREGTVGSLFILVVIAESWNALHIMGTIQLILLEFFHVWLCVIALFFSHVFFSWFAPAVKLWDSYLAMSQSMMSPCLVSFYKAAFKNTIGALFTATAANILPYCFLVVKNVRSMWCWHL